MNYTNIFLLIHFDTISMWTTRTT